MTRIVFCCYLFVLCMQESLRYRTVDYYYMRSINLPRLVCLLMISCNVSHSNGLLFGPKNRSLLIAEIDHCLHNGLCTVAKLDRCLDAEWNQCSIVDPTDAILFNHKTARRAMFGHTTLFNRCIGTYMSL